MPTTMQEFLAGAIPKAAADLQKALQSLPADRRGWKPAAKARTALDMVAECVLINEGLAETLAQMALPASFDVAGFEANKAALAAQDESLLLQRFMDSAEKASAAARALPDDALTQEIALPWGAMTTARLAAVPMWNMSYHEGQIYYIASLLDSDPQTA